MESLISSSAVEICCADGNRQQQVKEKSVSISKFGSVVWNEMQEMPGNLLQTTHVMKFSPVSVISFAVRHLIQNQGKPGLVEETGQSGAAPLEQLPWQAGGR